MNFKSAYTSVLAAGCVLMASCGGGGGGGTVPAGDNLVTEGEGVPSSAQGSVGALMSYVRQLVAGSSDSAEPIKLGDITLPVDNTAEPASL